MINAHIGLTYACNMNCSHCYVKEKNRQPVILREDELLEKLELLGCFYITYTMGETLLWKGFPSFAQKAKNHGFYQILLSNGSTIQTHGMVSNLIDLGIKKVGISIDSAYQQVHDANRQFDGAYQLACNAISLLSNHPDIWLQIAMTIGNHNLHEIPLVITQMREIGANSFSFLWTRGKNGIEPIENIKDYEEIMRFLIKTRDIEGLDINVHDYRMNSIVDDMYINREITLQTKQDILNMNSCHALSELVLIDPSGDMYACNFSDVPFANIYSTPLETIAQYKCKRLPLCEGKTYEI